MNFDQRQRWFIGVRFNIIKCCMGVLGRVRVITKIIFIHYEEREKTKNQTEERTHTHIINK